MKRGTLLVYVPLVCLLLSCGTQSTDTDSSSGGGGSSTFTSSDIVKAWTSNCMASTDVRLGTSYYRNYLTLYSNGSFMFKQYLHTGTGGSNCNNANYVAVFTLYGAYSVGSVVSGSMQAIAFAVNVTQGSGSEPDLMIVDSWDHTPSVTQVEDAFNTDCGGTSPYCTLSGGSCTNNGTYTSGQHADSQHMTCQHYTFPNTGSDTLYNVATYSNGVLTLGAGVTGVPGVFSLGSLPSSVTVTYQ